jgi:hypothetical protein
MITRVKKLLRTSRRCLRQFALAQQGAGVAVLAVGAVVAAAAPQLVVVAFALKHLVAGAPVGNARSALATSVRWLLMPKRPSTTLVSALVGE